MVKLKAGDIVEYVGTYEYRSEAYIGRVGFVIRVYTISGDGDAVAVEWLLEPESTSTGLYPQNLRKLGEVQHG